MDSIQVRECISSISSFLETTLKLNLSRVYLQENLVVEIKVAQNPSSKVGTDKKQFRSMVIFEITELVQSEGFRFQGSSKVIFNSRDLLEE